ncbi:MAG: GGDEF domain-containing protein [Methylophilaceae bacterium]
MLIKNLLGLDRLESVKDDSKVLYFALLTITLAHALFIPFFYFLGIPQLSIFNVLSLVIYLYSIRLFYHSVATSNFTLLGVIVSIEVIAHAYIACFYLGVESGFHYYIFGLAAFPFVGVKSTVIANIFRILVLISLFILLEISLSHQSPEVVFSNGFLKALRFANITFFLLITGSVTLAYTRATSDYQQMLTELASIDKLTGLDNRRSLILKAEKEIEDSQTTGEPLSMLVIDIDHFKQVNDTYGHLCGDYILLNVAKVMQLVLRKQDVVGRWGGEEFLVLLPNAEAETLTDLAERLRVAIEKTVFSYDGKQISISVTIGAATLINEDSFDSLTSRADRALYLGKENGRNRYQYGHA